MPSPAHRPARRLHGYRWLVALPIGLALLVGCSGDRTGDDVGTSAVVPEIGQPADGDASAGDESGAGGGGAPENAPPGGALLTKQIVRSGDVVVDVDDITSAANRVTALVTAAGGNVGSEQRRGDAADGSADLVVRVPSDSFDEILEAIGELGEEVSRSIAAEDVSTVVADVDARVQSMQGSVDRLRALAAQAVSVSDLITIESELTARQSELESLQAQQRALADQVSLATLSVRLTASGNSGTDDTGFLAGLADGWNALLDAVRALISVVGLLLPWLVLVALIAVPVVLLLRRRRRPRAAAPAQGAPISEPAGSGPARQPE